MEPILILKKKVKINTDIGSLDFVLQAMEFSEPQYTIVIALKRLNNTGTIIHTTITNESLATEIKDWLDGKLVEHPALVLPLKTEEAMMKFIKFAKPPPQRDLIAFILSRCQVLFSRKPKIILGGMKADTLESAQKASIENPFPKTVEAAIDAEVSKLKRPSSAPIDGRRSQGVVLNETQRVTKELVGASLALQKLSSKTMKGRTDAKATVVQDSWSNDHFRLAFDIETGRRSVENVVEQRRRLLAIALARQGQTLEKYKKIRDRIHAKQDSRTWENEAAGEVEMLSRIQADVEDDILRQKCHAQRASDRVRWTMAPNGYVNRRGEWKKGPYLGPGALPPDATTKLADPKLEQTVRHYNWDQHGRRHRRRAQDIEPGSEVELAMDVIRKAAKNASLYKLDLHAVFDEMDTSHDGFITIEEMDEGLRRLGVRLDRQLLRILFRHFDPNDSGAVHYGEFMFSFFNRRAFLKDWKRSTSGMNKAQIANVFHTFDRDGDGSLTRKELQRVLQRFKIEADAEVLIRRFDVNGDGELDIDEFMEYIGDLEDTSGGTGLSASLRSSRPKASPEPPVRPAKSMSIEQPTSSGSISGAGRTTGTSSVRVGKVMDRASLDGSATVAASFGGTKSSRGSDGTIDLYESLDEQWIRNTLQQQEKIERTVGKDYFK